MEGLTPRNQLPKMIVQLPSDMDPLGAEMGAGYGAETPTGRAYLEYTPTGAQIESSSGSPAELSLSPSPVSRGEVPRSPQKETYDAETPPHGPFASQQTSAGKIYNASSETKQTKLFRYRHCRDSEESVARNPRRTGRGPGIRRIRIRRIHSACAVICGFLIYLRGQYQTNAGDCPSILPY